MSHLSKPDPSYRFHRQSGQAVVTLTDSLRGRRDFLLGKYDTPESREKYHRLLAEWNAAGRRLTPFGPQPSAGKPESDAESASVNEVMLAFLRHAEAERYADDSRELGQFKLSLRPLRRLYGTLPAAEFSPKKLKALQQAMATGSWMNQAERDKTTKKKLPVGWCRNVVNRRIGRIKTLFKWAASEELVSGSVYQDLRSVAGLPKNAKGVRHTKRRASTSREDLDKVLAKLRGPTPAAATMLELQWLSGMRSCEVRLMKAGEVDRSDPACWLYRPAKHKNDWREGDVGRVVPLGPECQRVLSPWLAGAPSNAYLFRPARLRKRRHYTAFSYAQAVRRACQRAGVKVIPYGGRHAAKMRIERVAGADAARAVLGQTSIQSTQHYGQLDTARAAEVMRKLG
jgi:integrase